MSVRQDRICETLKQEIGRIIVHEIRDPRLGFATVTKVKLSNDMRHADVFVSVLGDEAKVKTTMRCLEHARGHIQSEVASAINMKFAPVISLKHDTALQKADHISRLIKQTFNDSEELSESGSTSESEMR